MDDSEADKAAIMAVLKAETHAWLRRDFPALASHWVHSPQTRRMTALPWLGTYVDEGWDAIGARLRRSMERFPTAYHIDRIRWEGINIVLGGDMAWVSYDQIGTDTGDDFDLAGVHHELKIFHRVDNGWKIGCLVLLERMVEHAACPLIEVAANGKVLWMNRLAEVRMRDHPGLVVAAGRLRARRRDRDPALREALCWAFRQLHDYLPPTEAARPARAVPLGEDEAAAPLYCWVLFKDNKALVSFDDAQLLAHRLDEAAAVYGLSPAQLRLARLILDGHDLASASELLGVSVNTLRTHLQRTFDRTGVRSQAALVRVLLSAEAPTK